MNGPLLIACNHPNSFLDAIILATIFKRPIYSLARGDSFKNKFISFILEKLNILPVYRISEGSENLNSNYDTFAKCREIFKKDGIVLIFSEGLCINEWKLRPLKKGTARLAFSSWEEGIDLTILPAGINYHSFRSFGKIVELNFGETFNRHTIEIEKFDGHAVKKFNEKLKKELSCIVHQIDSNNIEEIQKRFSINQTTFYKPFLLLPSIIGKWIHAPVYLPLRTICRKMASESDHYDSILVGLLFIVYPIFLFLITICAYLIFKNYYSMITLVALPFCAWAYVQLRNPFKNK